MEAINEDVRIKKFHWRDLCIKCDKAGKVLTCHHDDCPIVVHEDCLGREAHFDAMGNFCCPYCAYKRACQDFDQAERKALLAEKTLSGFLDGKGAGVFLVNKESDVLVNRVGDNVGVNGDVNRAKVVDKEIELQRVVGGRGDERCSGEGKLDQQKDVGMDRRRQSGDKMQIDAIQNDTVPKHHQDAGCFEADKIMEENAEAVEENDRRIDEVQNQEQAHKTTETIVSKESAPQVHVEANGKVNDTTASTCMDTNTISEKITGAQPPHVNTPRRSSRKKQNVHIEKSGTPCKSSKVAKPPPLFTNLPTLKKKRKRLACEVMEEELQKVVENQDELERVVRGSGDECCSGEVKVDQQKDVGMDIRRQFVEQIQNDAIQTDTAPKQYQDAGHVEAHKIMKENAEVVAGSEETTDEVLNQEQAHRRTTEKIVCKESASKVYMEVERKVGGTTASTCMDTNTVSEKVNGAKLPFVITPRRSSRKKETVHTKKSGTPCKSSKVAKPPTIFTKLPTLKGKRKPLAWKVEEEEMLKEAVQKYSKIVNKNLPWQKILDEGRAVFDETRTPVDLKDKWRNILSKDPLLELS